MAIYIVRHGQSEGNLRKILQGLIQTHLTEEGKEQMRLAAIELSSYHIDFKYIVSSDLIRAMESAQIISSFLNLPIVPMELLRERDWGKYTGMDRHEARIKYYHDGGWDFPDSAETDQGIFDRAKQALSIIEKDYPNSIVVTHGQFARNLIAAKQGCSYHEIPTFKNAEIKIL